MIAEKYRELTLSRIWILVFVYASIVSIAVQFVVLPVFFPNHNCPWAKGMILGTDSATFHLAAVKMYHEIQNEGWSAWRLSAGDRANNIPASGIAGIMALIYALTIPEPWVMIPLNAALHATAAVALILIFRRFTNEFREAALAAIPFIFFPTSMGWYAQIHKDGFVIAGLFIYMLGVVGFIDVREPVKPAQAAVTTVMGGALIWLMRPYQVQMLLPFTILIFFVIGVKNFALWRQSTVTGKMAMRSIAMMVITCVFLSFLTTGGVNEERIASSSHKENIRIKWTPSHWLPDFIDNRLYVIAQLRKGFQSAVQYAGSSSQIDADVGFLSSKDLISYIPRAIEIAFLAPFPDSWFDSGGYLGEVSSYMRKLVAIEMIFIYVLLPCAAFAVWQWRWRAELWALLVIAVPPMIIGALVYCTSGTLHRMRYGNLTFIIGFGILWLRSRVRERKARKLAAV